MQYYKFRADQLFDGYRMRGNDVVLIMTQKGVVADILPLQEAGDEIQYHPGILSPGFINCHCHLELSHMKNRIAEKTGLVNFVSEVMQNRYIGQEEITTAIENAEEEMIRNGIVAVGDICNNTLTIPQKIKGRIRYHNFIEASGFPPSVAEPRFQHAVDIFKEYEKQSIRASSNSIVPHAPYSVSPELWNKIIHFPGNQLLTIHNQETLAEDELFLHNKGEFLELYNNMKIDISFFKPSGKTSLQTFLPYFLDNQQVILVHNVHTSREDLIQFKRQSRIKPGTKVKNFLCLCPNANLYISGILPDVEMLASETGDIVFGTDSLASNQQLSILAEMQTIRSYFPSITTEQLYQWATLNGAKALQMDNILGSFECGKQPGVMLSNSDLSASRRLM